MTLISFINNPNYIRDYDKAKMIYDNYIQARHMLTTEEMHVEAYNQLITDRVIYMMGIIPKSGIDGQMQTQTRPINIDTTALEVYDEDAEEDEEISIELSDEEKAAIGINANIQSNNLDTGIEEEEEDEYLIDTEDGEVDLSEYIEIYEE